MIIPAECRWAFGLKTAGKISWGGFLAEM